MGLTQFFFNASPGRPDGFQLEVCRSKSKPQEQAQPLSDCQRNLIWSSQKKKKPVWCRRCKRVTWNSQIRRRMSFWLQLPNSLSFVLFSMISTDINEAREQLLLANKTKEKTGSRFHDRRRTKNDDWGFSHRTTILFYSRLTFHGSITNGIYELFTGRRPEIYP